MGFWFRTGVVSLFASGFVFTGATAFAQGSGDAPAVKADPVHGKAISYTCLGCHGVDGYRNAYPNYSVPKLAGQHPEYIIAALQEYKGDQRSHLTMHSQASELSDQDMADIAAYFSGTVLKPGPVPTNAPPAPAAVAVCAACHGATGISVVPNYPILAGQHADYLKREIAEYKDGGRKNPIMVGMAATIKDSDVDALADYFSKMQPSLGTLNRPFSILSAGR
ncbi:MAG TPA: c-type cytochrome [Steroidobacteraceae bacterium]|jgi:cytochrome c553